MGGAASLFGGFGFPEPIEMRSLHLLVFTPPLFLLYPAFQKRSPQAPAEPVRLALDASPPPRRIYGCSCMRGR
jgi:hypothetical protein